MVRRSLLLLFLSAPAVAGSFDLEADVVLDLVRPHAGEGLEGGTLALIEWETEADLGTLGITEWEAFLSFDDGVTYPVRVTPHLDRDERRFWFRVPDTPTDRASLLLRVGDEEGPEVERSVVPPVRFSIRRGSGSGRPTPRLAVEVGEAARPGEDGVTTWAASGAAREPVVWSVVADAGTARPQRRLVALGRGVRGVTRSSALGPPTMAPFGKLPVPRPSRAPIASAVRRALPNVLRLTARQNE